jgi:hypothetical protein
MRISALLVLLGALFAGASVSGCGSCDMDCGIAPYRVVSAELINKDGDSGTLRTPDGKDLKVRLWGPTRALHEGRTYQFPLPEKRSRISDVQVKADCTCGPYIANADGSDLDTALFHIPFVKIGVGFVGVFIVAIGAWALVRHSRNQPASTSGPTDS